MMEVSLHDILNAREARARRQQTLLTQHRASLLCFTMNIAGPVKTTPLVQRGFYAGLEQLDRLLPRKKLLFREARVLPTGCEAYYAIAMPAPELKHLCADIEESHPLCRLFDMDVIGADGAKLERRTPRGCIVCGKPGRGCAAGRLHPVSQLQAVTQKLLTDHFEAADREYIAGLAYQSLLDEVYTTPKPGLVDRRNNGSHKDMELSTFAASAAAIKPYFAKCAEIGQGTAQRDPEETFPLLRQAGLQAEEAMFRATGGVNTHKGAIYTLGLLCGSIGRLWTLEKPFAEMTDILAECARLAGIAMDADLSAADGSTAGLRLYKEYGLKGIRGELAAGLPSVMNTSLPADEQLLSDGHSQNDAGAITLLHLIAQVQDTNLYHRGGCEGAAWAANAAKALLPRPTVSQLEELDDAFIARNLSPGGCADLLAVTYFLHRLKKA